MLLDCNFEKLARFTFAFVGVVQPVPSLARANRTPVGVRTVGVPAAGRRITAAVRRYWKGERRTFRVAKRKGEGLDHSSIIEQNTVAKLRTPHIKH